MKILLTILIVSGVLIAGFLYYMGMFATYEVAEETVGPFKYAYKSHKGPYTETGQIGIDVYNALKDDGIDTTIGLGVYYDNPKDTPKENLRSEMGSIINESDYEKLPESSDKYNVKDIPETLSMVVRFPIKNNLSYMMGPIKVYPLMEKYMKEKGYSTAEKDAGFEIYDMENNVILFTLPVNK